MIFICSIYLFIDNLFCHNVLIFRQNLLITVKDAESKDPKNEYSHNLEK